MLERVLAEIAKLPPPRQEEVASWLLAELDEEGKWAVALDSSPDALEALANAALEEHRAGRTEPLDPSRL